MKLKQFSIIINDGLNIWEETNQCFGKVVETSKALFGQELWNKT